MPPYHHTMGVYGMRRNLKCEIQTGKTSGFTLVELLVVITIIGILIALLLPAVQAAREAARRMQCANNFKQVGVAMHNYAAATGTFPPGMLFWWNRTGGCSAPPPGKPEYFGWGWAAFLLPYIEQQGIYDQFKFQGDMDTYNSPGNPNSTTLSGRNLPLGETRLTGYLCPSDSQQGELMNYTYSTYAGHSAKPEEDLATTNMAGVCDSRSTYCNTGGSFKSLSEADGVMATIESCAVAKVTDGLSNTLLVGEITGGPVGSNAGRPWVNYNLWNTADGINGPYTLPGGATSFSWTATGFSSYHPGGCHFLLGDGSVQFFSQNIDAATLAKLTTRAGGEIITGAF
jgi:prepilin-type N-terminal cleavage/methylation domain-containing protein/prepilin-type processing-associated H-X9-DG protein